MKTKQPARRKALKRIFDLADARRFLEKRNRRDTMIWQSYPTYTPSRDLTLQ